MRNISVFYYVAFKSLVIQGREWVASLLEVIRLAHSLRSFVLFLDALLPKLALRLLLNLMRLVLVLRKAAAIVLALGTSLPASLLRPQFVVRFVRIFEAHIASCLTLRQRLLPMKIRADVIEHVCLRSLSIYTLTAGAALCEQAGPANPWSCRLWF